MFTLILTSLLWAAPAEPRSSPDAPEVQQATRPSAAPSWVESREPRGSAWWTINGAAGIGLLGLESGVLFDAMGNRPPSGTALLIPIACSVAGALIGYLVGEAARDGSLSAKIALVIGYALGASLAVGAVGVTGYLASASALR